MFIWFTLLAAAASPAVTVLAGMGLLVIYAYFIHQAAR